MKVAPEFASYPQAQPLRYPRWVAGGAGLLVLLVNSVLFGPWKGYEPMVVISAAVSVFVLWLLLFLVCVLFYRFNRHNAQCFAETKQQIQQAWWARHRQNVGLVDTVLLGPACSKPEDRHSLFNPDHKPPKPKELPKGKALHLDQVFGDESAERERKLAALLVLQWREQLAEPLVLRPLSCYWQGSFEAWQAFVEQMAKSCPQVLLPERAEPWQGIDSLDAIVDQLQGASAEARILCGGCQSLQIPQGGHLPAGEGAVLWLLAPRGGVRLRRGEWHTAEVESLTSVAERALQQSALDDPPTLCVSFSQPDVAGLSDIGWNTRQNLQDANFGALGDLEPMVVLTLAASHALHHGKPCAWLAHDPHHTLALGVVEPDDPSN